MEAISRNPAELFTGMIERLCRLVAAEGPRSGLAGPLVMLIWHRLTRMGRRFAALVARVQAGTLPAMTPGRRRAASPRLASTPRPPSLLPRGVGWLTRLVPKVCTSGGELYWLLQQPEIAAVVAAAPQAGRILRPLCRMLGVELPRELRLPRRRAAAASPAPAAAEAAERPGPPPVGPVLTWDNPKPPRRPAGGVTRCDPPPEWVEQPWIRNIPYSQRQ